MSKTSALSVNKSRRLSSLSNHFPNFQLQLVDSLVLLVDVLVKLLHVLHDVIHVQTKQI